MQLVMQLLAHYAPQVVKPRANAKGPLAEEVVLRERLRGYSADRASLGAFFKINPMMATYASNELARGRLQVPVYTPFVVPEITQSPWPARMADPSAAIIRRKVNRRRRWRPNSNSPL